MVKKSSNRDPAFTRRQLKIAARREFNENGYFKTDSNKIAKLANLAAGTFYSHFQDKLEIFLDVYRDWLFEQFEEIERALSEPGDLEVLADRLSAVILHSYSHWKNFRASARVLALSEERVAKFKASRRVELVTAVAKMRADKCLALLPQKDIVTFLILTERLADAIIDGEYQELSISLEDAKAEMKKLVRGFLSSGIN